MINEKSKGVLCMYCISSLVVHITQQPIFHIRVIYTLISQAFAICIALRINRRIK